MHHAKMLRIVNFDTVDTDLADLRINFLMDIFNTKSAMQMDLIKNSLWKFLSMKMSAENIDSYHFVKDLRAIHKLSEIHQN